jgi:hypothetical protein
MYSVRMQLVVSLNCTVVVAWGKKSEAFFLLAKQRFTLFEVVCQLVNAASLPLGCSLLVAATHYCICFALHLEPRVQLE